MKREIFWEAHPDSTSFPSGGRKIYHERSAIGDMLSAIHNSAIKGLGSEESSLYSYMREGIQMLSVNDLIDIDYIPTEDEISLQLLVDFYEEYLCKRIFIFTLKNGNVIKLFFRDGTELFHVSGIDHIYDGVPMDGKRFLQGIKDKTINLATIENINAAAYKDYIVRIRSMACLDAIIKKCEYLWFSNGKIPDSKIEVKYLLLKGVDQKNLHLGIDSYKENKPYYSKTLLVTEGNTSDKFVAKADERMRVIKLEIRNKDTDELLVFVDRAAAERIALEEITKCVNEWLKQDFQTILYEYLEENVGEKLFETWIGNLNRKMLYESISFDPDIQAACEIESDLNDEREWEELFLGIIKEKLLDEGFMGKFLLNTLDDFKVYEELLLGTMNRSTRDKWKSYIKKVIDENKTDIREKIQNVDCYTSGKILGDAIRKYEKDELNERMLQEIKEIISKNGEDIVATCIGKEIMKEKNVERIAGLEV